MCALTGKTLSPALQKPYSTSTAIQIVGELGSGGGTFSQLCRSARLIGLTLAPIFETHGALN
jgi:hypothetical protein